MANVAGTLMRRCVQLPAVARLSTSACLRGGGGLDTVIERHGNRFVVGYGFNGEPNYIDRVDFPIPAVRFKEDSPQISVGGMWGLGESWLARKLYILFTAWK